ncbi:hypothetical protein [Pseudomonas petrae]|uniref:Uncharacterized protein n=1 Tax=Pseudomonas petrae TaxID=2912190 RepID=A0ABS9IDP9_9PSED|nr:hypothetical protein [Pseudomonas petrae]MCF7545567.1 hypothetical protein [Pseudomonas petrae]
MTQTKLLVIVCEHHMSTTQRAEFDARVKAVADKVGAELLVLEPGQYATLLDVCVLPDKAAPSQIKEGLCRCSASRSAFYREQLCPDEPHKVKAATALFGEDPAPPNAIQGEAMSFMLDPLEQAIESAARVMRDELGHMAQISMTLEGSVPTTSVYKRMGDHLDALLAAQLARVSRHE